MSVSPTKPQRGLSVKTVKAIISLPGTQED